MKLTHNGDHDKIEKYRFWPIKGVRKFFVAPTLSPSLGREPVYHYLHKKHEALVPKIDGVFKEMQKDGTLERLRAQFLGELLQQ